MYNYQLIRNHYVVDIGGSLYFIDTGCPSSYTRSGSLTIDGRPFRTGIIPETELAPIRETVGAEVSGLIGCDILTKTSLTIHKDGFLNFAAEDNEGETIDFAYPASYPVGLPCDLDNGKEAVAIIDTGAMIYYGKYPEYFFKGFLVGEYDDYNPQLKMMRSKFYKQTVRIGSKTIEIPVGDNAGANGLALRFPNAAIVMNVTELFERAVVFDFERREIIFN